MSSAARRADAAAGEGGALPAVTRTRLADHAYAHLLNRIVTGAYGEGTSLPSENSLCRLFEISRPVVREALDRLRADGLVESRQGAGTFVRPRPADDRTPDAVAEKQARYLKNLEFRGAVEPRAAALAALRRTPDQLDAIGSAVERYERVAVVEGSVGEHLDFAFHLAVAEATDNAHFVEAIRGVAYDIDHGVNLLRYLAHYQHLSRSRSVLADHARVLEAVRRADAAEAEAAMRAHIEHARLRVLHSRPSVDSSLLENDAR